ncbi:ABC transporter permease [Rhodococcus rhodochrous]|uniref:ABC transporter permease n=1 Tax=Rhodococcus rhodochrous TaxID=1829 RepID=A0AAW4XLS1_RHORH|nr:ABC transporter permease [Rhodococcus rhodochrous]MCD2114653.1 ABC transporter permease [Rhodococcus rhodochrous]
MTVAEEKVATAVAAAPTQADAPAKPPSKTKRRIAVTAIQVAVVAAFLAVWEWASRTEVIDPLLFGRPSEVWTAFFDYVPSPEGLESLSATFQAVGWSFVIGSILGTVCGFILGLSKWANDVFGPFLVPLNSIPRIALAPMFIAWFGLTMNAKVFLAVTIVFFILAENARSAVQSVDTDLMTMARVVGLKGPALIWKVVLPSAVPTMFAGLRLTFTYALLGVIASEMIAATNGIGQDIVLFSSGYQINTVFAIIIELVIIAVFVNAVFQFAERRLLRWQD